MNATWHSRVIQRVSNCVCEVATQVSGEQTVPAPKISWISKDTELGIDNYVRLTSGKLCINYKVFIVMLNRKHGVNIDSHSYWVFGLNFKVTEIFKNERNEERITHTELTRNRQLCIASVITNYHQRVPYSF